MGSCGRETEDYPRFVVDDDRVWGQITLGRSRLPVWSVLPFIFQGGWRLVESEYDQVKDAEHYPGRHELSEFLANLVSQTGNWGRLVCVLADEMRRDGDRDRPWKEMPRRRARVRKALQACIDELDAMDAAARG